MSSSASSSDKSSGSNSASSEPVVPAKKGRPAGKVAKKASPVEKKGRGRPAAKKASPAPKGKGKKASSPAPKGKGKKETPPAKKDTKKKKASPKDDPPVPVTELGVDKKDLMTSYIGKSWKSLDNGYSLSTNSRVVLEKVMEVCIQSILRQAMVFLRASKTKTLSLQSFMGALTSLNVKSLVKSVPTDKDELKGTKEFVFSKPRVVRRIKHYLGGKLSLSADGTTFLTLCLEPIFEAFLNRAVENLERDNKKTLADRHVVSVVKDAGPLVSLFSDVTECGSNDFALPELDLDLKNFVGRGEGKKDTKKKEAPKGKAPAKKEAPKGKAPAKKEVAKKAKKSASKSASESASGSRSSTPKKAPAKGKGKK